MRKENQRFVQVNVSQELLPSLLHTARCFKIKGLDNVQPPPGLVEQNVSIVEMEMHGTVVLAAQ